MQLAFDSLPFRCPHCHSALINADSGVACVAGHAIKLDHGVLDFYVPFDNPTNAADWNENASDVLLRLVGERTGLTVEELESVDILGHVKSTGVDFLDAEEDLFLDRFDFKNVDPKLRVIDAFTNGCLTWGDNWIAVRLRNESAVTITSTGPQPVLLSYHLFDEDGQVLVFEGRRSGLPIDLKPGQEITAHLDIEVPPGTKNPKLQIVPVHETVCWLDDCAYEINLSISQYPENCRVTTIPRTDFSEAFDNELAAEFITKHSAGLNDKSISLEIGGGHDAILTLWQENAAVCGTVINNDISVRMLKLASLKSTKFNNVRAINARFDANRAPIYDRSVDCVTFSRSLHHFADPVKVLKECHRVLKDDGILLLLCEPAGHTYDEFTRQLMRNNVNEQVFPVEGYLAICIDAGFQVEEIELDWGFSLKGAFRKSG